MLSNLLTNAAKYTDPDGHIHLRAERTDETVTISVLDTGIGIPPEALPRIFAMFSQVKSSQDRSEGGLGIGLALAKGLVELHGGTIEARSAGSGPAASSSCACRPHGRRARTAPHVERRSARAARTQRECSIADDNRDAAESLAMLLRWKATRSRSAHDGGEALAAFARCDRTWRCSTSACRS